MKNDFLYGEVNKDIYIKQLSEYVSNLYPDYVCKLKKTLYELTPQEWYEKIAQYLYFCGYTISYLDPSLFL